VGRALDEELNLSQDFKHAQSRKSKDRAVHQNLEPCKLHARSVDHQVSISEIEFLVVVEAFLVDIFPHFLVSRELKVVQIVWLDFF
jgi:hypothetical protein